MDAKNVACFLLVIFTFAVEAKKLPAGDSKVPLDHSVAIFPEEETVNDPNDEACKVNCTTLRNQMMERIADVIDDVLSKNLQCTALPTSSSTPQPTTKALPTSSSTPQPTTKALPTSSSTPQPTTKAQVEQCGMYPVGVTSPMILPDSQMTASSRRSEYYEAANGRLRFARYDWQPSWCSKEANSNDDWLQVDLGKTFQVCGFATQGNSDEWVENDEWTSAFKLTYSSDGNTWTTYKDTNGQEVEFHRGGDNEKIFKHKLPVQVSARYIRFHPTQQNIWNCLRVEVYICTDLSEISFNSAIISGNKAYECQLSQFLVHAVGESPHWKLCYRASTHGWAAKTFHSRCDGKRDTVTIVKVGQYVFGGYVDIPWDASSYYKNSSKAFIFSLHNSKEGFGPFKSTVRKGDTKYAIYPSDEWGPYFADRWIFIADKANTNKESHFSLLNPTYYYRPTGIYQGDRHTILAGSEYATPDDWEVFYLALPTSSSTPQPTIKGSSTPQPTTKASPTPKPTTNGPMDSFTMESRIISDNKSYKHTLQEFLKPAVGDVQHWKLCYRYSTDDVPGSKTLAFHAQCDGKPNTVTLVKVGDYVFGGYCDLPWERDSHYKDTPNPFIFSLRNKEGLQPFKAKIAPWLSEYAILDDKEGPDFGGWSDLEVFSFRYDSDANSISRLGDGYKLPEDVRKVVGHYMYPAGSKDFNPDEVEVFYLG